MTAAWQRFAAIAWVAVLGVGVLLFMALAIRQGIESLGDAGWLTAGFLALREIISKIENIALGIKAGGLPADSAPPDDDGGEP